MDEDRLSQAILALAGKYGRYGYRRITALLRNAGWPVGKDRVQRISARAVSAERVGPAISVGLLSGLFSSGMFTLPAPLRGAPGVDCRRSTPASQMRAGWGPAVAASLLPVSGELNAQMCSLTPRLKLSHFR